tara:strand:- start:19272 stop:19880 length:609 start_codon:yes stop_codon:yes gene_type:complete
MKKDSQVTKDVEVANREEAKDLGIQDFFVQRDKSNRGTEGLVEDAKQVVANESSIKEELYEKSLKVNKLPSHIVPMFGGIFLTARRNKLSENGIYLPTASYGKGSETDMDVDFADKQIVLSCGPHVNQLVAGMEVRLNMDNFKKRLESTMAQKLNKEYEFELPIEIIEGVEYLYVSERDIKYVSNNVCQTTGDILKPKAKDE